MIYSEFTCIIYTYILPHTRPLKTKPSKAITQRYLRIKHCNRPIYLSALLSPSPQLLLIILIASLARQTTRARAPRASLSPKPRKRSALHSRDPEMKFRAALANRFSLSRGCETSARRVKANRKIYTGLSSSNSGSSTLALSPLSFRDKLLLRNYFNFI